MQSLRPTRSTCLALVLLVAAPLALRTASGAERGDVNLDSRIDSSDALLLMEILFTGKDRFLCLDAADANGDGRTTETDGIYLLEFLVGMGPSPSPATLR